MFGVLICIVLTLEFLIGYNNPFKGNVGLASLDLRAAVSFAIPIKNGDFNCFQFMQ